MSELPQTRYAKAGDLSIAYQVAGEGPIDLLIVPGLVSHVECFHELPGYSQMIERFTRFARVIRCAVAIRDQARALGIDVRAGLHTGECERRGDDLAGIAVHIGARVAAHARAGEVLVTSTVRDLVAGSGIAFTDRGEQALAGVPEPWRVLAVSGGREAG